MRKNYSRRQFIRFAGLGAAGSLLAACGAGGATRLPTATPVPVSPTKAPTPTSAGTTGQAGTAGEVEVMVGDVVDHVLSSEEWPGDFGSVTLKLHEAFYNGDIAYHIRTDASDPTFAQKNGLVYVPLLNAALSREDATSPVYFFENSVAEQRPVLSTVPGMDDFSPATRVHQVTFNGPATLLDSAEKIEAAEAEGDITIEKSNLILNYSLIKWPDGGLSVDSALEKALGDGQLFKPVDTSSLTVTMKLHQCFPGSRYIVTDTSAAPMAPMMNIAASPPTQALAEVKATDKIWVFGNGIPGSGVMGFQPAIFGNKAGDPAWSPFWDHFTLVWKDEAQARVLRSAVDVREALDAGEVDLFNGVPDSHPNGFVVNCPAPILAPNTFAA
jgi:hypothetical protein